MPYESAAVQRIAIDETAVQQLDQITNHVRAGLPDMSETEFFDAIDACAVNACDILPATSIILDALARHVGAKALVVTFPPETVADVGATPDRYCEIGKQRLMPSDIYRALLGSIAGLYAFGNTAFQHGAIHHDIIYDPHALAGYSSAKDAGMRLHVDGLYVNRNPGHLAALGEPNLNLSPDFLSFHFQRNKEKVPTTLVIPEWGELSKSTIDALSGPILHLSPDMSIPPLSILYGDNSEDPWIRYVTDEEYLANAVNEADRAALRELNEHLFSHHVEIVMQAGEVLFFDNRRLLHSRPTRSHDNLPPQAEWRWQRRVHYSTDPERLQPSEISPRVVNTHPVYRYRNR